MSDDELVSWLFRISAELARRLPGRIEDDVPMTAADALAYGWTATTRDDGENPSDQAGVAQHG